MKTDPEQLSAMYGKDDDDDTPREQPEQLRLAGKATLIPHRDGHLPVPRIDYVETLERQIAQQKKVCDDMASRIKKLESYISRSSNIAERRISALESLLKEMSNRRQEW